LVLGKIAFCLLSITYLNWIDKRSHNKCATIENCKINRLLFADDSVLLSSTESGRQRTLIYFAAACDNAEMKISITKTEVTGTSSFEKP